jgi:hypothetical protein
MGDINQSGFACWNISRRGKSWQEIENEKL